MSIPQPAALYAIANGARFENIEIPVYQNRNPTIIDGTNGQYPIGKRWINILTNQEFVLTSCTSIAGTTTSTWVSTSPVTGTTVAMVAGTVTVSSNAVLPTSRIIVSETTAGGTQGILSIGTIVSGTSFVINSSSSTDTSTVTYAIYN